MLSADEIGDRMARAAALLTSTLADAGVPAVLDYSPGSVQSLDSIIETEWPPGEKPSDQVVGLMGAYLGEVLVRTLGGAWATTTETPEPGVRLDAGMAFPISKVRKRVDLGPQHSLPYFYSEVAAYQSDPARSERWTQRPPPALED